MKQKDIILSVRFLELKGIEKSVLMLLLLQEWEGVAKYSLNLLCEDSGFGKTAVIGAIKSLESQNIVTKIRKTNAQGAHISNDYEINLALIFQKIESGKQGKSVRFDDNLQATPSSPDALPSSPDGLALVRDADPLVRQTDKQYIFNNIIYKFNNINPPYNPPPGDFIGVIPTSILVEGSVVSTKPTELTPQPAVAEKKKRVKEKTEAQMQLEIDTEEVVAHYEKSRDEELSRNGKEHFKQALKQLRSFKDDSLNITVQELKDACDGMLLAESWFVEKKQTGPKFVVADHKKYQHSLQARALRIKELAKFKYKNVFFIEEHLQNGVNQHESRNERYQSKKPHYTDGMRAFLEANPGYFD